MNKKSLLLAGLLLLILASPAAAAFNEYYTYGGFSPVTIAFDNIALIFSDVSYKSAISTLVILGFLFAGAGGYLKVAMGQGGPLSWLLPLCIGIGIYFSMYVPTGSLAVFDPVYNQTKVINGVPVGVIWTASLVNHVERYIVESYDNNAPLPPATSCGPMTPMQYQEFGGAVGMRLMQSSAAQYITDANASKTLTAYINDCVAFELNRPGTSLTMNSLLSPGCGSSALDKMGLAASPSNFTTDYMDGSPQGVSASCGAAYTSLNKYYTTATNSGQAVSNACGGTGFTDQTRCQEILADQTSGTTGESLDASKFISNLTVNSITNQTLVNGGGAATTQYLTLLNQAQNGSSSGFMAGVMNPYMIEGYVAYSFMLMPILVMFLVTPLWKNAFSLIFSLMTWTCLLRSLDVITFHQWVVQYQQAAAAAYNNAGMGLDAAMRLPSMANQYIGTFASMRNSVFLLATAVSGGLFKFGDSALSRLADKASAAHNGIKEEVADRGAAIHAAQGNTVNAERAAMMTALQAGTHGFNSMASGSVMGEMASAAAGAGIGAAYGGNPGAMMSGQQQTSAVNTAQAAARAGRTSLDQAVGEGVNQYAAEAATLSRLGSDGKLAGYMAGMATDQNIGQTKGAQEAYDNAVKGGYKGDIQSFFKDMSQAGNEKNFADSQGWKDLVQNKFGGNNGAAMQAMADVASVGLASNTEKVAHEKAATGKDNVALGNAQGVATGDAELYSMASNNVQRALANGNIPEAWKNGAAEREKGAQAVAQTNDALTLQDLKHNLAGGKEENLKAIMGDSGQLAGMAALSGTAGMTADKIKAMSPDQQMQVMQQAAQNGGGGGTDKALAAVRQEHAAQAHKQEAFVANLADKKNGYAAVMQDPQQRAELAKLAGVGEDKLAAAKSPAQQQKYMATAQAHLAEAAANKKVVNASKPEDVATAKQELAAAVRNGNDFKAATGGSAVKEAGLFALSGATAKEMEAARKGDAGVQQQLMGRAQAAQARQDIRDGKGFAEVAGTAAGRQQIANLAHVSPDQVASAMKGNDPAKQQELMTKAQTALSAQASPANVDKAMQDAAAKGGAGKPADLAQEKQQLQQAVGKGDFAAATSSPEKAAGLAALVGGAAAVEAAQHDPAKQQALMSKAQEALAAQGNSATVDKAMQDAAAKGGAGKSTDLAQEKQQLQQAVGTGNFAAATASPAKAAGLAALAGVSPEAVRDAKTPEQQKAIMDKAQTAQAAQKKAGAVDAAMQGAAAKGGAVKPDLAQEKQQLQQAVGKGDFAAATSSPEKAAGLAVLAGVAPEALRDAKTPEQQKAIMDKAQAAQAAQQKAGAVDAAMQGAAAKSGAGKPADLAQEKQQLQQAVGKGNFAAATSSPAKAAGLAALAGVAPEALRDAKTPEQQKAIMDKAQAAQAAQQKAGAVDAAMQGAAAKSGAGKPDLAQEKQQLQQAVGKGNFAAATASPAKAAGLAALAGVSPEAVRDAKTPEQQKAIMDKAQAAQAAQGNAANMDKAMQDAAAKPGAGKPANLAQEKQQLQQAVGTGNFAAATASPAKAAGLAALAGVAPEAVRDAKTPEQQKAIMDKAQATQAAQGNAANMDKAMQGAAAKPGAGKPANLAQEKQQLQQAVGTGNFAAATASPAKAAGLAALAGVAPEAVRDAKTPEQQKAIMDKAQAAQAAQGNAANMDKAMQGAAAKPGAGKPDLAQEKQQLQQAVGKGNFAAATSSPEKAAGLAALAGVGIAAVEAAQNDPKAQHDLMDKAQAGLAAQEKAGAMDAAMQHAAGNPDLAQEKRQLQQAVGQGDFAAATASPARAVGLAALAGVDSAAVEAAQHDPAKQQELMEKAQAGLGAQDRDNAVDAAMQHAAGNPDLAQEKQQLQQAVGTGDFAAATSTPEKEAGLAALAGVGIAAVEAAENDPKAQHDLMEKAQTGLAAQERADAVDAAMHEAGGKPADLGQEKHQLQEAIEKGDFAAATSTPEKAAGLAALAGASPEEMEAAQHDQAKQHDLMARAQENLAAQGQGPSSVDKAMHDAAEKERTPEQMQRDFKENLQHKDYAAIMADPAQRAELAQLTGRTEAQLEHANHAQQGHYIQEGQKHLAEVEKTNEAVAETEHPKGAEASPEQVVNDVQGAIRGNDFKGATDTPEKAAALAALAGFSTAEVLTAGAEQQKQIMAKAQGHVAEQDQKDAAVLSAIKGANGAADSAKEQELSQALKSGAQLSTVLGDSAMTAGVAAMNHITPEQFLAAPESQQQAMLHHAQEMERARDYVAADGKLTDAGYAAYMEKIAAANQKEVSHLEKYGEVAQSQVLGENGVSWTQQRGVVDSPEKMEALAQKLEQSGYENTAEEIRQLAHDPKGAQSVNFQMSMGEDGRISDFKATGGASADLRDKVTEDKGRKVSETDTNTREKDVSDGKSAHALASKLRASGYVESAKAIDALATKMDHGKAPGFHYVMSTDRNGHITNATFTGGATVGLNDMVKQEKGRLDATTHLVANTSGVQDWSGDRHVKEHTNTTVIEEGVRSNKGNQYWQGDRHINEHTDKTVIDKGLRSTVGDQVWTGERKVDEHTDIKTNDQYAQVNRALDGKSDAKLIMAMNEELAKQGSKQHVEAGMQFQATYDRSGNLVSWDIKQGGTTAISDLKQTTTGETSTDHRNDKNVYAGTSKHGSGTEVLEKTLKAAGVDEVTANYWSEVGATAGDVYQNTVAPIANEISSTRALEKAETRQAEQTAERAADKVERTAEKAERKAEKVEQILERDGERELKRRAELRRVGNRADSEVEQAEQAQTRTAETQARRVETTRAQAGAKARGYGGSQPPITRPAAKVKPASGRAPARPATPRAPAPNGSNATPAPSPKGPAGNGGMKFHPKQ